MKKVILITALAVISLTLFSFRSTESNSSNSSKLEVTDVENFSVSQRNFSESCETFPDNFTSWRRDWVDYSTISKMNISLDEMNATLEKF